MHTDEHPLLGYLSLENSGVPIYVQLREQWLRLIGENRLRPGDQMPTMRQVAVALRIDLNTVRRAYDELERMGVIELIRGRGSFVASSPPPADPGLREAATDALARQVMAMAAAAGIDPLHLSQRIAHFTQDKENAR